MNTEPKFFDALKNLPAKPSRNTPACLYNDFYRNGGRLQRIPLSKTYNPYKRKPIKSKSIRVLKGWEGVQEAGYQAQLKDKKLKNLKRKEKARLGAGTYPQCPKDNQQVK